MEDQRYRENAEVQDNSCVHPLYLLTANENEMWYFSNSEIDDSARPSVFVGLSTVIFLRSVIQQCGIVYATAPIRSIRRERAIERLHGRPHTGVLHPHGDSDPGYRCLRGRNEPRRTQYGLAPFRV